MHLVTTMKQLTSRISKRAHGKDHIKSIDSYDTKTIGRTDYELGRQTLARSTGIESNLEKKMDREEGKNGNLLNPNGLEIVPSDPTNIADEAVTKEHSMQIKELMDFCTKLQQRVLDLENTKTAQAKDITSLKFRVKRLEKKGGSRTHKLKRLYKIGRSARVVSSDEANEKITLVDETQGRHDDDLMFDTGVLNDEEVFTGQDMAEKEVSTTDPVTTAGEVVTTSNVEVRTASPTTATITNVELTLAQTLSELKSERPKTKGVVMQEPTKEDEEEKLAKEKAQKVEESNIAWDDIQAKVKAN
ncbi:hypothetical protein Tco_0967551 [Tanacetum coccineum]